MKKVLFIMVLFLGLANTNAQSDATLDETITWLTSFGEKSLVLLDLDNEIINIGTYLSCNKEGDFSITYDTSSGGRWQFNTNKDDVETIILNINGTLFIDGLESKISRGNHATNTTTDTWWKLFFKSIDDSKRFYKALKHYFSFFPEAKPLFKNKFDVENKF